MANKDSAGLQYLTSLKLGFNEMQWLQDMQERLRAHMLMGQALEAGWVLDHRYTSRGAPYPGDWGIDGTVGAGKILIESSSGDDHPHIGVLPSGQIIWVSGNLDQQNLQDAAGADIVVPDDGVIRTLVAYPKMEPKEPGTLTLTGAAAAVVGVDTLFTRHAVTPRKTKIRIDAADSSAGNEGTYTIQTITNDLAMTIDPAPLADESGVQYRVIGEFFTGTPADPDIHNNPTVYWGLVARTLTAPAGGLIVADVLYDTGSGADVEIFDRRRANLWRPKRAPEAISLQMDTYMMLKGSAGDEIRPGRQVVASYTDLSQQAICAAPAATGSNLRGVDSRNGLMIVVADDVGATNDHTVSHYVPEMASGGARWQTPDGGATVNIVSGADVVESNALVAVPVISHTQTSTHLYFYADTGSNTIKMYRTVDHGVNWTGPTNVMTLADGTDRPIGIDAILLRNGQLRVYFVYDDNVGVVQEAIRYITSDDYGLTWSTNGTAGFTAATFAGSVVAALSVAETDSGAILIAHRRGAAGTYSMHVGIGATVLDISMEPNAANDMVSFRAQLVPLGGEVVAAAIQSYEYNAGAYNGWVLTTLAYLHQGQSATAAPTLLDIQPFFTVAEAGDGYAASSLHAATWAVGLGGQIAYFCAEHDTATQINHVPMRAVRSPIPIRHALFNPIL